MSTQQAAYSQLVQYLQTLAPAIQVASGSNLWAICNAVAMAATGNQTQINTAAAQYLLSSAYGDGLTALAQQFGVTRKAAIAGTAPYVISARQAPTAAVTVPAGTVVQTPPQTGQTTIQYTTLAAATIPAGQTSSNTVAAQALVGGTASNVATNTLTVVAQAPSGVTGTNTGATGSSGYILGADAESDADLRARTLDAIAPQTTKAALKAAALAVTGVFDATIVDPADQLGDYTCYACQSDGTLPGSLNSAVLAALQATGQVGLTPAVSAFTLTSQAVAATVVVGSAYTYSAVAAQVSTTITNWVNGLKSATPLLPTDLIRAVFGAQPNYTAIAGVTDITITTPSAPVSADTTHIIRLSGTPTLTQGAGP